MSDDSKTREDLARQANIVRSRLLHTVEELDRRRHDAFDVGKQLQRHVFELAVGGAALVFATAATVGIVVHRVTTAESRRRSARWALARDLWLHPERRLLPPKRSFLAEVARSVALAAVTTALSTPTKRAVAGLIRAALDSRERFNRGEATEAATVSSAPRGSSR